MSREGLLALLRSQPFVPFRIFSTDGRVHDVKHPDRALLLRSRVILPVPDDDSRSQQLSLIDIIRAEELQIPSSGSNS